VEKSHRLDELNIEFDQQTITQLDHCWQITATYIGEDDRGVTRYAVKGHEAYTHANDVECPI
jgi:hypothetical protein